jgi:hypothetical protein
LGASGGGIVCAPGVSVARIIAGKSQRFRRNEDAIRARSDGGCALVHYIIQPLDQPEENR